MNSTSPTKQLRASRKAVRRADSSRRGIRGLTQREQKRYRDMLMRLSTQFIALPSDQFDQQITDGLRQLVEAMGVQRSSIGELNSNGRFAISHSYAVRGFRPMRPAVLEDELPWFAKVLREGKTIRLTSPEDLPSDALKEREVSRTCGIKANITLPFSVGGMPTCVLGIGSSRERTWPDELIPYLKQAGEIFANALARKRKDEQLRQSEAQLEHLARVSTMGQLASSIAHEVNQPLCAIVSNAQAVLGFISDSQPDIDQAVVAIKDIIRDGQRSSEIIGRTNAMLRRHAVASTLQDINQLVTDALPLIHRYATLRSVDLKLVLSSNIPTLMCDAVQLQQVLVNLIMNGVDAIPKSPEARGWVEVETSFDSSNQQIKVRVSDNGIGFSAVDMGRVFEPFFTSKSEGLGMGLAISRTIVEARGGRLWAEPEAKRGACFSFVLPTQRELSDVTNSTIGDGRR